MVTLHAVIERAEHNFGAYVEEIDGVGGIGDTLEEVKRDLEEGLVVLKEACIEDGYPVPEELQGEYEIVFKMDTRSFLKMYCKIFFSTNEKFVLYMKLFLCSTKFSIKGFK